MDVCEQLYDCAAMDDNLATSGDTNDSQGETNLRESVQRYVNGLIDKAVVIVEMERDAEESVRMFYGGLVEDVSIRVANQWADKEKLVQDNIHQMQIDRLANFEKNKEYEQTNIPRALTTAVGEHARMTENGTTDKTVKEVPTNDQGQNDKNEKHRRFKLFKKRKPHMKKGNPKESHNEKPGNENELPERNNRKKVKGKSINGIQDVLMSTLPVSLMIVPRAVTSLTHHSAVNQTCAGPTPLTTMMQPSVKDGNINSDERLPVVNDKSDADEIKLEHKDENRTKPHRWTRLGRLLKTCFGKRNNFINPVEETLEDVCGAKPVMEDDETEDNIEADHDDLQTKDMTLTYLSFTQRMKERFRHLVCSKQ